MRTLLLAAPLAILGCTSAATPPAGPPPPPPAPTVAEPEPTGATIASAPPHSVAALRSETSAPGDYLVEGIVVAVQDFPCPPCPAGAECKPCFPPTVILADHDPSNGADFVSIQTNDRARLASFPVHQRVRAKVHSAWASPVSTVTLIDVVP